MKTCSLTNECTPTQGNTVSEIIVACVGEIIVVCKDHLKCNFDHPVPSRCYHARLHKTLTTCDTWCRYAIDSEKHPDWTNPQLYKQTCRQATDEEIVLNRLQGKGIYGENF